MRKGVTAHRPFTGDDLKPSTAWHTDFEDVNNDGRVDLFIAKGNVDRHAGFRIEGSEQPAPSRTRTANSSRRRTRRA